MSELNRPIGSRTPDSSGLWTNALASCWGLVASYQLVNSVLVTHVYHSCLVALVPLVTGWAIVERKRWGRLALLGISVTAVCLFLMLLGWSGGGGRSYLESTSLALPFHGGDIVAAILVLALAALSAFWLRRPQVVAEFERGKRHTLAMGQRAIAASLVACWGLPLLLALPAFGGRSLFWNLRTGTRHCCHVHHRAASSVNTRPAPVFKSL